MQNKKNHFQKGLSLIETIVAIALFILGIQATVMIFSKTIKSKAYSMEMGKASFVVSRSISDLTKYIRKARRSDFSGPAIELAEDNKFVFYSDYDKDGDTERLRVSLANGSVYLEVCEPDKSVFPVEYSEDYEAPIKLADHIVNDSESDPMFSYYNNDYPADKINNPVSAPVSDKSEIRLVKILLKINIDPNNAPENIQQETFVEMRNLSE